jgi:hypothetical protein
MSTRAALSTCLVAGSAPNKIRIRAIRDHLNSAAMSLRGRNRGGVGQRQEAVMPVEGTRRVVDRIDDDVEGRDLAGGPARPD